MHRLSGEVQRMTAPVMDYPWVRTGACDVEELLTWAVGAQRIDLMNGGRGLLQVEAEAMGMQWYGSSTDGVAAIERIAAVGCRIDISGPGRLEFHPVAEMVASVVNTHPLRDMVMHYARSGRRPEAWRAPKRWVRPEMWDEYGVSAQWVQPGRRNGVRYCPVIITCSEEALAAGREQYAVWRAALVDMAWAMRAAGSEVVVLDPAAPEAPWEKDEGKPA